MFSYYGSKSKLVDYYPPPKFDKIIEPFAGSARYSLKYWQNDILLIDKYKLDKFDYEKALAGFASTANFDYTREQFHQLLGIGEFNMRANEKVIGNLLRERFDAKRPSEVEEEEIIFGE